MFKNFLKKLAGFRDEDEERRKALKMIDRKDNGENSSRSKRNFQLSARMKAIIGYSWPFLVLLIIFAFGWQGLKPYIKELAQKTGMIGEHLLGDDEEFNPDDIYEFSYGQADLKPARSADVDLSENYLAANELPEGIRVGGAAELAKILETAEAGGTIIILPGEYAVNLEISRNINIFGYGSSTALKAANPDLPVIRVTGAKAVFKNFSIVDSHVGISAKEADIKIGRLKFSGLEAMALWIEGGKLDLEHGYINDSGQGIGAFNSSGRIKASIIQNSKKSGIELLNSDFQIGGNIIENSGSYGVFGDRSSKLEFEGNYIENNQGFNVRIEGKKEIYR